MRRFVAGVALWGALLTTGCRSAYIEATVRNETGGPVRLVEVDYPSASFGKESLAAGAEFHYRFKIIGSSATKVTWTDADRKEHTVGGPVLKEGDEGRLLIQLHAGDAVFAKELSRR